MRSLILDGKNIDTREALHTALREALDLPSYYGNNLDALWDALTGWVEMPLTIRWIHFYASEKKLGNYSQLVLQLFKEAEDEIPGFQLKMN
ncbi:ribonuclease inhibitor [Paenibacillus shirakamiensis]|uniref:Ribonuclease inhibitor n=1 Tax=Paenibacillus shirakamiensis TaxID=1265935 RepID=A0ABS4JLH5_9BACL|nr:barstar family protein [Paenibacillus shirakamiensis]MBP2001449.1 ribonuclease inhibitor [Paenibacillus shirakamiensis]